MIVTFIGFSGTGKSHLAARLVSERGFRSYVCDELIEARLESELPKDAPHGTRRVGVWLGQPYSDGYALREEKYLLAEKAVMREVCAAISEAGPDEKIVVDTTGSVIYTGAEIIAALRAHSYVIYFRIPEADEERMYQQYLEDPKPVIWQNMYSALALEKPEEALHRCYRALLRHRAARYERCADLSVPAGFSEREALTPEKIIELMKQA